MKILDINVIQSISVIVLYAFTVIVALFGFSVLYKKHKKDIKALRVKDDLKEEAVDEESSGLYVKMEIEVHKREIEFLRHRILLLEMQAKRHAEIPRHRESGIKMAEPKSGLITEILENPTSNVQFPSRVAPNFDLSNFQKGAVYA